MRDLLAGHIQERDISAITGIIIRQYKMFLSVVGSNEYIEVFSEEYAPHNKQRGIAWAVASGFPDGSKVGESLSVRKIKYGRGHVRPELFSDTIIIHILNSSTNFSSEYLSEYYTLNDNAFSGKRLYAYYLVSIDHGKLKRISLCVPDKNGNTVEERLLFDNQELKVLVAKAHEAI